MFLQVQPFEYDLVLQPDLNTRGHTQWYFFAVSNTRAGQAYRFNIINLLKEDSLYNMGMLPLMHSEQHMQSKVCNFCGEHFSASSGHVSLRDRSIQLVGVVLQAGCATDVVHDCLLLICCCSYCKKHPHAYHFHVKQDTKHPVCIAVCRG